MSSAGYDEPLEVEAEGVRVAKSFEAEKFPAPVIRFDITSTRDDAVTVRLSDMIPDGFPTEEGIGFHPEYGNEYWTVYEDQRIEFEREVAPGGSVTTVYGIRADDDTDIGAFLHDPIVSVVDPGATGSGPGSAGNGPEVTGSSTMDDIVTEDSNRVAKDMIASDGSGVPEVDDESDWNGEIDLGDADIADDTDDAAVTSGGDDGSTDADDSTGDGEGDIDKGGSVAAALAAELEAGRVSAADRQILRGELNAELTGSDVARLEHIRQKVDDLEAYTEALEEFLDNNGTADQLVGEVRSDLSDLRATIGDIDSSVSSNTGQLADIEGRVDDLGEMFTN